MKLYFLRHADAFPAGRPGLDAERELSVKGRRQCTAIAEFLQEIDVEFDVTYSSPLVRARQTAEAILPVTNHKVWVQLELVDELRNETPQASFERWLKSLPEEKHVLLVGHNPTLTERLCRMLGTRTEAFDLPKAGLACVRTEDRKTGELQFFVSPKILSD